MKRLFGFLLLIYSLSAGVQAQFLKFGVCAGLSSSSVNFTDVTNIASGAEKYNIVAGNAMVGFHFGLFGRIKIANLFVQPELLFTSSGGQVKVQDLTSNTESIKNQTYNKIDVPVLAGLKFGPARIEVGPVASFTLSQKSNFLNTAAYTQDFKKATIGYQAGVGLDILKTITVDLKYEGSLSKIGNGLTIDGNSYPFDSRNSQFILSLGLFF
jgi:opacity protein-like surface antigen